MDDDVDDREECFFLIGVGAFDIIDMISRLISCP